MSANLQAALKTAAAGGFVFPALVSWNAKAAKLDKKPAITEWQAKATLNADQIKAWWQQFPAAVPGIELGRSNLFAVDLDRHAGGADGVANFKTFRGDNPAPQCPTTKTPSGGYHLYFRQPEGERLGNRTGTLPAGVDCRGEGGWTVAPGAVFEQWRWVGDAAKLATVSVVPHWIVSAVQARKTTEYSAGPAPSDAGKRERAYAEKALANAANKVAASQRGSRNSELNAGAFCLGTLIARGWIGAATVEGRLHDAAAACGLIADDGERAVRATLKSAIEAGLKEPHADLLDREWKPERETAKQEQTVCQPNKSWRDGLITAKALQTKTFAPVRIIVPGLIPEGVTIVAGKPKIGKSFLALDICMAVAGDRFVLGETKPVQGDALYLALEDNERRLKKRIDKLLQAAAKWPELEIHTEWRRVDQGGLDDLKEWCEAHPKRRLIWIDTFVKIRPLAGKNEQSYGFDYRSIEGLQKLAGEYQVGIVINHHLRKASSEDDAFDDVSGTLGLTGAADTIIIMKRMAGMVKVFVRGRDIEEREYAAEFNKDSCRWRLVGEADEVFRSEQRQAIATALREAGRPMSSAEIMAATERRDRNSTEVLLHKMEKAGEVKHAGRGQWVHPDIESHPTESGKIGEKVRNKNQGTDGHKKIGADESYRNLTDEQPGKILGKISEAAKPLPTKGGSPESNNLTDLTGSERIYDPGPIPESLRRAPNGGSSWPPALGPAGDDVFDIDPKWRSRTLTASSSVGRQS